MKLNPSDAAAKKDLELCMKKFMEQRKKKIEEEKNKPKIQEIEQPTFKKVQIEEGSDTDSDDAAEETKSGSATQKSPRNKFNQETLSKAKDKAHEE